MSEMGTLTIRLPRAYLERLDALAASTGRSKSSLASEAMASYLSAQEWQFAAISESAEAADAGAAPVDHSAVASWLRSWGSRDELSRSR